MFIIHTTNKCPTYSVTPKQLSRSYTTPESQPTPAPISITEIIFELKAITSTVNRERYDIELLNKFDDKTGMHLQDIFDLAVFSCVEYISLSRIILPFNEFNLISSTKATLNYSIQVTDCKTAIEIAKIFNNPMNAHTFNKFVEYSIKRQLSNNDVCSYSVIPANYEIACCSWIHGYWKTDTLPEVLIWQDWKSCTFTIPQTNTDGTINGDMIMIGYKYGEYDSSNNTIQWHDGTEWILDITKYPHFKTTTDYASKIPDFTDKITNARVQLGDIFKNTTLKCNPPNCASDISKETMKLIDQVSLIDATFISQDCGNVSIDYETVGVSTEESRSGPDTITAYNIGSTMDTYQDTNDKHITYIFVGGINNQIDTGFDFESVFKPATFVAKFMFDTTNNSLLYKDILQDVDRRSKRFGRNTKENEDERMWGDVRDMKLGDGCAVESRYDNATGLTFAVEVPCLYVMGYSPSLRAAYIRKINVGALITIPVKILFFFLIV